jgi:hypothetical protein
MALVCHYQSVNKRIFPYFYFIYFRFLTRLRVCY